MVELSHSVTDILWDLEPLCWHTRLQKRNLTCRTARFVKI